MILVPLHFVLGEAHFVLRSHVRVRLLARIVQGFPPPSNFLEHPIWRDVWHGFFDLGSFQLGEAQVPPAEKPAGRTGEESSASEAAAEVKDSAPEAKTEEEAAGDGGGGDATAEPPPFPKGYLIVLVVCLALAVFKNTVGKI